MEQELELELKNIVTQDEFQKLIQYFSLQKNDFIKQVNHYFDTENFELKALGSALRIREKNNTFTLTLKQPYKDGLLESNEKITQEHAEKIIKNEATLSGDIAQILIQNGVKPEHLKYLGSLSTYRAEVNYDNGTLVFDHSIYLGKEDFELEYEVKELITGSLSFQNLLDQLNIPRRDTINKIVRFFLEKQKSSR